MAHWDEMYSNISYWNSREDSETSNIQSYEGHKHQNPAWTKMD